MENEFIRTELLIGKNNLDKLKNSHIGIFGAGGVGGYAIEALVRSGVKTFSIFDHDTISISNLNRQIITNQNNIGQLKTIAAKERILSINNNAKVYIYDYFYGKENHNLINYTEFDYIIDAIDTITGKILLIENAKEFNIPIISSMGAGNKLDPTLFKVADISKTSVCPLAKVMRRELKKRNITNVKVVFSDEKPQKINYPEEYLHLNKLPPASISFVPSVVGLIIGGEVIKDIIK